MMIRCRPWRWIRVLRTSMLPSPPLYVFDFERTSPSHISWHSRSVGELISGSPHRSNWERQRKAGESRFSSQALVDAEICGWTAIDIPLAQTGEGIAECELLQWFIQEGEEVEEFQPLCQVQSDKATIDITSRYTGRISKILYAPGDIIKVGATLVKMIAQVSYPETKVSSCLEENIDARSDDDELQNEKSGKVLSTPAVRHVARQYGIDLHLVPGTGKDGRVLKDDVLKFAFSKGLTIDSSINLTTNSAPPVRELDLDEQHLNVSSKLDKIYDDTTIPLRGFQRAMVKTMTIAAKVPHFHYVDEISCDALAKLRVSIQAALSDQNIKCTFLPLLIKSLSAALREFPWMNSCYQEESVEVILKGSHNIGVAMATSHGLVVPNIKNVQSLSIFEIIEELARLQILASNNKLSPEDVRDGTITLSNIGAIGGKFGTPLVNLPESAIIALGRIQKVPSFDDNGNLLRNIVMNVCIGADHRIVDGATVARFCNKWKRLIENPELLMLNMR